MSESGATLSDEPSPSELERLIARNHRETSTDIAEIKQAISAQRADFDRYVLSAVYLADQRATEARERAMLDRISKLETENEQRARGNRSSFWTSMGAVVAVIIGTVLAYLLARGGAH